MEAPPMFGHGHPPVTDVDDGAEGQQLGHGRVLA